MKEDTQKLQPLFDILRSGYSEGRKIEAQTQAALAEANAEIDHRLSPEDIDAYARDLERAQRVLGVREVQLTDGEF